MEIEQRPDAYLSEVYAKMNQTTVMLVIPDTRAETQFSLCQYL